jgi:hypothetical protein
VEPPDIIARDGCLNLLEGDYVYSFNKDGRFFKDALLQSPADNMSARLERGTWTLKKGADGVWEFVVDGHPWWINSFSPNDHFTIRFRIWSLERGIKTVEVFRHGWDAIKDPGRFLEAVYPEPPEGSPAHFGPQKVTVRNFRFQTKTTLTPIVLFPERPALLPSH